MPAKKKNTKKKASKKNLKVQKKIAKKSTVTKPESDLAKAGTASAKPGPDLAEAKKPPKQVVKVQETSELVQKMAKEKLEEKKVESPKIVPPPPVAKPKPPAPVVQASPVVKPTPPAPVVQKTPPSKKPMMVKTSSGSFVPESMVIDESKPQSTSQVPDAKSVLKKVSTSPVQDSEPVAKPASQVSRTEFSKSYDDEEESSIIPLEKSNKRLYMISFVSVFLIILTTVAILFLRKDQPVDKVEEEVTEVQEELEEKVTVSVEEEDEEEKEEEEKVVQLEREEITLEILNGSGTSGLAGETAAEFEELGYVDVGTGNSVVITGSQLYVHPDYEDTIDVLLDDVADLVNVSSVSGKIDDSDVMARIILGK